MIQLHYSGLVLKISSASTSSLGTRHSIHMEEVLLNTESNPLFEFFDPYYSRNGFSYWVDDPPFPIDFLTKLEFHFNHTRINSTYQSNPTKESGYDRLVYLKYFTLCNIQ